MGSRNLIQARKISERASARSLAGAWLMLSALWLGLSIPALADLPDFTKLVKNNEAAVVNISTVGEQIHQMQHVFGVS